MDSQDVELVKKIVRDELVPALEIEGQRIEANVIATTTAAVKAFKEEVRREVRLDHAENRTRLQQNYKVSSDAARDAAKAVAGNEFILTHLNKQDTEASEIRGMMQLLLAEVKTWTGRREGEAAADVRHAAQEEISDKKKERKMNILKWFGGLLASGGVYRWLAEHFHWPVGGGR